MRAYLFVGMTLHGMADGLTHLFTPKVSLKLVCQNKELHDPNFSLQ